jgi:hypothetical protein
MKRKRKMFLLLITVVVTGCATRWQVRTAQLAGLQDAEVRDQVNAALEAFGALFETRIDEVVTEIERHSANRAYRRAAILWRTHMVPACQDLSNQRPSPEVLIELWLLCQQQFDYLDNGKGAALFGPHQAKAVTAAGDILRHFEDIPRKLMSPENFEQMRRQIQSSARAYPMTGEFLPTSKLGRGDSELAGTLLRVMSIPMTPLNALRGMGKAPESVLEVSAAVDRFTAVTEDLPANARWQLRLLATEVAEHETVTQTVDGLTRIAGSAQELNRTLAEYPAQIATQTQSVLNDAIANLPAVQKTLADTRDTVTLVRAANEEFRGTLASSERLLDKIREASDALTETAEAVQLTSQEILKFVPASKKDETGQIVGAPPAPTPNAGVAGTPTAELGEDRAFSFQAVTESAVALQFAARELLPVLAEVRDIIAQQDAVASQIEQAGARLDTSLDRAATSLERGIDHAAWRAFQVLAAVLVMLVVYRGVASRVGRRSLGGC